MTIQARVTQAVKHLAGAVALFALGTAGCSRDLSRSEAAQLIQQGKIIGRDFHNPNPNMAECEAKVFDTNARTVTNRWNFAGRTKDLAVVFGLRPEAATVLESARIERTIWNDNWTLFFVVKVDPQVTVTGVTVAPMDQSARLVYYDYVWPNDRIAKAAGKCFGDLLKGSGKAEIKRYDDGWRLEH